MTSRLAFWVRLAVAGAGFGLAVLSYVVLRLLPMPMATRRQWFARVMSRLCCRPLGLRLTIVGRERIPTDRPCVFVANHQSQIDYPILASIYRGDTLPVASQIGDWPALGWLYRTSGSITLDRDVPVRSVAALRWAEQAIREQQLSIWMFPEGTRGRQPGHLGPFKRGAFRLAASTGVPIVPVVVSPLKPRTDLRGRRLSPQTVVVRVLDPVLPAGADGDSEEALRTQVRARMVAALSGAATP